MSYFLGLDSSTQGLSSVLIDMEYSSLIAKHAVDFERDLPEYNLKRGILPMPSELVKHSDPVAWVAAVELLFQRMVDDGVDMTRIAAISGSAQQHGTVYLKKPLSRLPAAAYAADSIVPAVRQALSRNTAPIWMDSSTTAECTEIAQRAGGRAYIQQKTGSLPVERFAGPQIRKFYKQEPEKYQATQRIHLVSSFMASVLTCGDCPIDYGDGAGMNLMDIGTGDWAPDILDAVAPDLHERLPALVPSDTAVGKIGAIFVRNFGFSPDTRVVAWSGDNPNSLIGVGGWSADTTVVSLGTSDTCFAAMKEPHVDPAGYGHVFGNPAGAYMGLICFKNGSLAREKVRDEHGLDWGQFDKLILEESVPGNSGNMMLPYFVSEVTPTLLAPHPVYRGSEDFVCGRDPAAAVRAVVEAQCLSMRYHTSWFKKCSSTLRVTGGGSQSTGLCQVIADVFNASVERLEVANSAAAGAAMRAAQSLTGTGWERLTDMFCHVEPGERIDPVEADVEVYEQIMPAFLDLLEEVKQAPTS